jgi:hypothetical protein
MNQAPTNNQKRMLDASNNDQQGNYGLADDDVRGYTHTQWMC